MLRGRSFGRYVCGKCLSTSNSDYNKIGGLLFTELSIFRVVLNYFGESFEMRATNVCGLLKFNAVTFRRLTLPTGEAGLRTRGNTPIPPAVPCPAAPQLPALGAAAAERYVRL